MTNH
jgi:hypothetical protein